MSKTFSAIDIPELRLFKKGKVREVYEVEDRLLVVASDRISAFDWVLPSLIPDKGRVLTQLAAFWFEFTSDICPNHMLTHRFDDFPAVLQSHRGMLEKRSMLVKKTDVFPVECVVRGYLAGSGWKDYRATGMTSGVKLPDGLRESDRLDEVIFTPATKAEEGHDINISFERMIELVGESRSHDIRRTSIELYRAASAYALDRGIIIADTKFEFGLIDGNIILVDEIFTPDSSRFWPVDSYEPGRSQASLDKQYVRDYLESTDWDKQSPPPPLPENVVEKTSEKYLDIFRRLSGRKDL